MQVLTFGEMVALAVSQGMVDGPLESMSQWDQIAAVCSAQDDRLRAVQPCLEGVVAGGSVWLSSVTGWVVEDGIATPITLHCGYSEQGCVALHNGVLYQWATMADPVEVPDQVWQLLQLSVWTARE